MKSENLTKIRKKTETGKKSGKNIFILYLISKLTIMFRNIGQIIEIRRFEKRDQKKKKKKKKKKEIFKLRSFAHEVKKNQKESHPTKCSNFFGSNI